MYGKFTPEEPTTALFMDTVLERKACHRHGSERGVPCWMIVSSDGVGRGAICNTRAESAGFNHRISEKSLRLNRPAKFPRR